MPKTSSKKKSGKRPGPDQVIVTKGLVKVFGTLRAVDGLALRVRRGQLYGLLGPNGSGKTTAIRMIMGLLKITEGEAEVLGHRMPDKSLMERIGYMPQETAVYRELTVHDNLVLFGEMYNVPKARIEERVTELLKLVELSDWRDDLVINLSGGMKHRLSLACCLMHDPEVMFLDEPTVGVDPELRDALWTHFKNLRREGKTIVITTHYIEEARHCDLVGLMRKGELIAEDTPRSLMMEAGTDTLEGAFLHFTRHTDRGKMKKRMARGGEEE